VHCSPRSGEVRFSEAMIANDRDETGGDKSLRDELILGLSGGESGYMKDMQSSWAFTKHVSNKGGDDHDIS
jgi:hypothetical protein